MSWFSSKKTVNDNLEDENPYYDNYNDEENDEFVKMRERKKIVKYEDNDVNFTPSDDNKAPDYNEIINATISNNTGPVSGGKPVKPTITGKKEILGKERCIYKKAGDRKEYVKYKGDLITVKDYKKIISVKKQKIKYL